MKNTTSHNSMSFRTRQWFVSQFLLLIWIALLPIGVVHAQDSTPSDDTNNHIMATIVNRNWVECPMAGCGEPAGSTDTYRTIVFTEDNRIYGTSGCNKYFGTYQVDGNRISFGPIAITRMRCEDDSMAQEQAFLEAIQNTETYQIDLTSLTLSAQDTRPVLFESPAHAGQNPMLIYLPHVSAER